MHAHEHVKYSLAVMLACAGLLAYADERPYLCEIGLQGGAGYYVGDATPHIFSNVRETYGAHFRYKFTPRWALQVKGMTQRITGNEKPWQHRLPTDTVMWNNRLINMDVMAECNFFRYGKKNPYDSRIKPYTPYIFLGVGVAIYGGNAVYDIDGAVVKQTQRGGQFSRVAAYIPFGIGFKWKFHDRLGLNIAWQHNLYIADNLEGVDELDNSYNLNGSNILNGDLTGQITASLVIELGKPKKICPFCEMNRDYYGL